MVLLAHLLRHRLPVLLLLLLGLRHLLCHQLLAHLPVVLPVLNLAQLLELRHPLLELHLVQGPLVPQCHLLAT